ncbi:hypothetical protein AcW2_006839 [Taiwanofungus camphoratus]|nr:hypothetical protein AcW2_006839 [Antrodia cinnamomea]
MASLGLRLTAGSSRAARLTSVWTYSRRIPARNMHYRKELQYPVEEGLGDFLSPEALKVVAVDYQQGLLDRLNDQVKGTVLEGKSIVQTVIEAAQDPNRVLEFNYASEALNNSFFLESLKPPPPDASSHQAALNESHIYHRLRFDYGSLEHFKSSFSAAVLGMFSSGWMWFVCDQTGALGIYPTFGPGTLLVRSRVPKIFSDWHAVLGEQVMKPEQTDAQSAHNVSSSSTASSNPVAPTSPASGLSHAPPPLHTPTPSRTFSSSLSTSRGFFVPRPSNIYDRNSWQPEHSNDPSRIGEVLYPLFCVSVHEHAWVGAGYGVWGKEEYMKRFWSVLDWDLVNKTYSKWVRDDRFNV